MLFSDIIGQDDLKVKLIQTVRSGKIPHALLFSGEEGVGTLALALATARYISCTQRGTHDACGKCPSCVKFNKLAHPDLHFVFPIFNKNKSGTKSVCGDFMAKWREYVLASPYFGYNDWMNFIGPENAQGSIFAEEGQEILRTLQLKSYESDYKFMLIWLPEKMHPSCANRLLKLIEEPPANTLFMLITESSEKVLGTIYSRTQLIRVDGIDLPAMSTWLKQSFPQLSDEECLRYARLSRGSCTRAMALVQNNQTDAFCLEQFVRCMRGAYTIAKFKPERKLDKQEKLKDLKLWSEEMAKIGRERQKQFFSFAQKMLRENFIMNYCGERLSYLNAQEADFSSKFYPYINHRNVEAFMQEFDLAERHIEQNVGARMVFFDLALKAILLFKK